MRPDYGLDDFFETLGRKRRKAYLPIAEWCNTHQRDAWKCRNPIAGQGGIMLPCRIIKCAEVGIEISE